MRIEELLNEQIDEAVPDWAKKGALAVGGAAALATGAHMLSREPEGKPVTSFEIPQDSSEQHKKAHQQKADPEVVNQMMGLLKTPVGVAITSAARSAGMKGRELAQFLAQCAHETSNFSSLKELGGRLDFKKYDIRFHPGKAKLLGNVKPGDGARYAGRGFIQLTGRDNYKRAGEALGLPLEQHPELVERPDVAAKVAIWYWQHRVHPKIHDYNDTRAVTKPINSGLDKLQDRHEKYKAVAQILGVLNWPK